MLVMKTSSAKAKGRRLAQAVKDALLMWAPDKLRVDDIQVVSSGVPGKDLLLSPAAQEIYPLAIECKNQETLNIWKALAQAFSNASQHEFPVVCFSRNREGRVYIAMDLQHFLKLIR
ncbi:MAG: hypothetical protein ACK5UJ_00280 [Pseudobdellovibrionaceae bacterium]